MKAGCEGGAVLLCRSHLSRLSSSPQKTREAAHASFKHRLTLTIRQQRVSISSTIRTLLSSDAVSTKTVLRKQMSVNALRSQLLKAIFMHEHEKTNSNMSVHNFTFLASLS